MNEKLYTLIEDYNLGRLAPGQLEAFEAAMKTDAARDFADLGKGGIYRREAQWFGVLAQMATPGSDKKLWMKELEAIRQDIRHPYQKEANVLWNKLREK